MRLEFPAPAELVRKDGIRVDVQNGVHVRACVGGSIVVVETDRDEVVGALPDGKPARAEVQVTRAHALVLLKLLALDDRYHNVRGPAHAEHDRGDAREITDDHGLRARHGDERFLAPPLAARVQNHPVSLLDEKLRGHSPEPIGRTCDEYPRHDFSPLSVRMQRRLFTIQAPMAEGEFIPIRSGPRHFRET